MAKKRTSSKKYESTKSKSSKKDFKYHVKHKSKLLALLVLKVLIVFFVSLIVLAAFYYVFDKIFSLTIAGILSFIIASSLYLFIVIKFFDALKHKKK